MSPYGHTSHEETYAFLQEHGIDSNVDWDRFTGRGHFTKLLLANLNERGKTSQHVTDTGADYDFSRLDYLNLGDSGEIVASRYVATIQPGHHRTELAYWTEIAPSKKITIHRGLGSLVIGRAGVHMGHGETTTFKLDPEVTPEVRLPSGRFYHFEGSQMHSEELVVSGFYEGEVDWEALEIPVSPGAVNIATPQGGVIVPSQYRDRGLITRADRIL
jgi:hypothetical protein